MGKIQTDVWGRKFVQTGTIKKGFSIPIKGLSLGQKKYLVKSLEGMRRKKIEVWHE